MSEENKKVGHVYQIAYDLGNGRQFSVNGNFSQGASGDEMFAEAVKCLDVADRSRARCELELLERELEIRFGKAYLEYKARTPLLWPRRPRA